MELGAFSISLAVKDLQAFKALYEKFGFSEFAGEASQNWLIMKNGDHVIRMTEADEATTGPASFIAIDPDGNPILVDQHV